MTRLIFAETPLDSDKRLRDVFVGSLLAVLLLGVVMVLVLRTRALPVCWLCGHHTVR